MRRPGWRLAFGPWMIAEIQTGRQPPQPCSMSVRARYRAFDFQAPATYHPASAPCGHAQPHPGPFRCPGG